MEIGKRTFEKVYFIRQMSKDAVSIERRRISMGKIYGYIRVLAKGQDVENQIIVPLLDCTRAPKGKMSARADGCLTRE